MFLSHHQNSVKINNNKILFKFFRIPDKVQIYVEGGERQRERERETGNKIAFTKK